MELSMTDLRELIGTPVEGTALITSEESPYEIGKNYFVRTVTHYLTGRVLRVTQQEIVVEDAAWIADTGRFADAIKNASFDEVEPYPDGQVIIGRGAVIDAVQIAELPKAQK